MSATSPLYGNPSTELLVNHTGSGGAVLIKDGGTVVFELKPGGEIVSKVDPLHLHGQKDANDTTIIFSDGVKTQELRTVGDEFILHSEYDYRLRPKVLRIDSSEDQQDGTIVEFHRDGTLRGSVSYTSGSDPVMELSSESTLLLSANDSVSLSGVSAAGKPAIRFTVDSHPTLAIHGDATAGEAILDCGSNKLVLSHSGTGSFQTIATFRDGATDALHVQRDNGTQVVRLQLASPGDLRISADDGAGYQTLGLWGDAVEIYRPVNSGVAENLVTFSSGLSAIRAGSVQVFDSGKKLRLGAEAASGRGLHLGWEGRSLAKMDYTAGDASIEFLDSNEDTSAMLIPDESNYYAGRDSTLTLGRSSSLGTDKRGHLVLRQEASNNAPGVLELKADDGKSVFLSLWSNSSGSYDLWATTSDPGNTKPTGSTASEQTVVTGLT